MEFKSTETDKGNIPTPPVQVASSQGATSNLREHITYFLVGIWGIIILGQAFGLISAEYRSDALLVATVGIIIGFLYEVKISQSQK